MDRVSLTARWTAALAAGLLATLGLPPALRAADPAEPPPEVAAPVTLGGLQFWADELVHGGWRIQRHVTTGHCRLLDDRDGRRTWGTFDQCQAEFDKLRRQLELPAMDGKLVVVLHGLARSRFSMQRLAHYLEREGGYTVLLVGYPSTRAGIDDHARGLASVIDHLAEAEELHLVGYSLGNLVIRHWMGDVLSDDGPEHLPPALGRVVMLGPPNHGAQRARLWAERPWEREVFRLAMGDTGLELGENFDRVAQRLATPPCPFGIVAGGRGDEAGFHPQLEGDDDGAVRVSETRLAGARDFVVVPLTHAQLMDDGQVHQYTLSFLREGHFRGIDRCQPVE